MSAIEYIAGTTITSSTATASFSNIPGTYTDLIIAGTLVAVAGNVGLRVRFNSDSGTNYSSTLLYGNGTSALSIRESTAASAYGAGTIGSANNPVFFHVFSYANTSVNKTLIGYDLASDYTAGCVVGLWRSTAAITTVTIALGASFPNTNISTATLSLWGVK